MTAINHFHEQTALPSSSLRNDHFISAIIPVYNEEKFLANFIFSILHSTFIDEIICVDDGSTDGSREILHPYADSIHIIELPQNSGKGAALAAGIQAAKGDIVLFLDADLKNLTEFHIHALLQPLLEKHARVVVGYCKTSEKNPLNINELISGQRAYYRSDLEPFLGEMATKRFGIEMYLNSLFHPANVISVPLMKLRSAYKYEKYKPDVAFTAYCREGKEIIVNIPTTVTSEHFITYMINKIKGMFILA